MAFEDKDRKISFTLKMKKMITKSSEQLISIVPLFLGSGETHNILVKIIPSL